MEFFLTELLQASLNSDCYVRSDLVIVSTSILFTCICFLGLYFLSFICKIVRCRERSAFVIFSRIKGQACIFKYNIMKNARGKERSVERKVCSWPALAELWCSGHPDPDHAAAPVGPCSQSCGCSVCFEITTA